MYHVTITELFKKFYEYGDRVVFRYVNDDDIISVTYRKYYFDILSSMSKLERVSANDKAIGVLSYNTYECYVLLYAALLSGYRVVMFNALESEEILLNDIKRADVNYVLYDKDIDSVRLGAISNKITCKEIGIENTSYDKHKICNLNSEGSLLGLFTSGTTGNKKLVELNLYNLFGQIRKLLPREVYDSQAPIALRTFLTLPNYHIGGIVCWICWISFGCTINLNKNNRNLYYDLSLMESDYSVVTPAIIKMFEKALSRGKVEKLGGLKCLCSVAAPLYDIDVDLFKKFGITIDQAYGMTETSSKGTINLGGPYESVGKSADGAEIYIASDGEIAIKSSGNIGTSDEWIFTGDLGEIDKDGYLYIKGRKKNTIILSGGENIIPEEIEVKLYGVIKEIIECMVYEKDEKLAVKIYCKKSDEKAVAQSIKEFNRSQPIYKKIQIIEIEDHELAKNNNGKLLRRV